MKSGDEVLTEMEKLDNKFFPVLKERQCKTNPYLAGFMSEKILTTEAERAIQRRLLQMTLVLFEIIGAGDVNDTDYVKVSKDSIEAAKDSKISFDTATLYNEKSEIAGMAKTLVHARSCIRHLNDAFNEMEGTQIDINVIWQKQEIFLKAYWIERQKK